ncbi:MAG: N-acetylmuramoyl-L-alanine amidase, family 2 [Cyanobacteria bacterium RYN_339]|nr:N-acetylmuramoyl-L-alanine amidase, family 2 [Cyanobacteria bacterium RYN_339]
MFFPQRAILEVKQVWSGRLARALAIAVALGVPTPARADAAANPNLAMPAPAAPAISRRGVARPPMRWMPANVIESRPGAPIDTIVIHHTNIDGPAERTATFFADPTTRVSAHYVVGKDGKIIQCVPDAQLAHHAGVSEYRGRTRVNEFSIGIEVVNIGDGVDPYPEAQYRALAQLVAYLQTEHGIGWDRVTGHKNVARPLGRKDDPSPNFDYLHLQAEVADVLKATKLPADAIPGDLEAEVKLNILPPLAPIRAKATRIAVVGGGVAGLSSAYELTRMGFKDVTLFEASPEVGGKVHTYVHPKTGRPYEVGAIVQSSGFENIYRLAKETGYAAKPADWLEPYPITATVVSKDGKPVSSYIDYHQRQPDAAKRYGAWDDAKAMPAFVQLVSPGGQLREAGVEEPGFESLLAHASASAHNAAILNALYLPTEQFLAKSPTWWGGTGDLSALTGRLSLFFNMTGYGYASEVPALYHMKFFGLAAQVGYAQMVEHSSGMTTARAGYQALFRHVGSWLTAHGVHMRVSTPVLDAKRPGEGTWGTPGPVQLTTAAGKESFDALVVATSPETARRYLHDTSPLERKMLENVRYYGFVTTIFEASPAMTARWKQSTVIVEDYGLDAASITGSHIVGLYNNDGSNVFTAYQFAAPGASDATIQQALKRDLARLGGGIERTLVFKHWLDYFPHYSSETLRSDGGRFLPEIVDLQGQRNTLYVTANYNFESTEHMAGFARQMMHRYFSEAD